MNFTMNTWANGPSGLVLNARATRKMLGLMLAGGCLLMVRPASAHFLWAEIDAPGNNISVSFADDSSGVTEGVPLEKIEAASAFTAQGERLALKSEGASRKGAVPAALRVAGASQTWGVLDKTAAGRGIYLLEYEAKASRQVQDAATGVKSVLELTTRPGATAEETSLLLTLRGKPVANNTLTLHVPGADKAQTVVTDGDGLAKLRLEKPGIYGVRAGVVEETKGELGGKKYDIIRRYTTLTFRVGGAAPAVPLLANAAPPALNGAGNPQANPEAYALLKAAHDARQVMPADFPGFSATLYLSDNGQTHQGTLVYRRQGKTEINVPNLNEETRKWLEEKVLNLLGHRRGGDFASGDGRHPLSWGKEGENNFGKLIDLNDRMQSSYRVKDNKVTEVTRVGGGLRFTISVMETIEADPGKYLANHFTVAYRDEKSGDIKRFEGYRDQYAQFNKVWIPVARYIYDFDSKTTPVVRTIRFRELQALKD